MTSETLSTRHELLRSRGSMDWGEAPRYNEAYRKIRWPAARYVPYVDINDDQGGIFRPTVEQTPERRYVFDPAPMQGPMRYVRPKPPWLANLEYQKRVKRRDRWRDIDIRRQLREDLKTCMRENIPFKTKTFEYKPEDNWIYVNGIRAIKYSIVTGRLEQFTYSGVYNKVTSLLFRMFKIEVTLIKRKPTLKVRSSDTLELIPLDINSIYDMDIVDGRLRYSPIVPGRVRRSHCLIDSRLALEYIQNINSESIDT